jgi:hypothetical protein
VVIQSFTPFVGICSDFVLELLALGREGVLVPVDKDHNPSEGVYLRKKNENIREAPTHQD